MGGSVVGGLRGRREWVACYEEFLLTEVLYVGAKH